MQLSALVMSNSRNGCGRLCSKLSSNDLVRVFLKSFCSTNASAPPRQGWSFTLTFLCKEVFPFAGNCMATTLGYMSISSVAKCIAVLVSDFFGSWTVWIWWKSSTRTWRYSLFCWNQGDNILVLKLKKVAAFKKCINVLIPKIIQRYYW